MSVLDTLNIWGRLANIEQNTRKIMVDVASVKQAITDLTTKVSAATSLDSSVATLIAGLVTQMKSLQDQIADLSAGSVTQAELDELAASVGAQADALDQGTKALQTAVPANT